MCPDRAIPVNHPFIRGYLSRSADFVVPCGRWVVASSPTAYFNFRVYPDKQTAHQWVSASLAGLLPLRSGRYPSGRRNRPAALSFPSFRMRSGGLSLQRPPFPPRTPESLSELGKTGKQHSRQAGSVVMHYPLTMNKIVIEPHGSAFVVRPPFGGRSHHQSERHVVDFLKALEKDLQRAMDDVRVRIEEFEGKVQAM
jgi:hypothetical protein